jgi:hypothetical protein
LKVKFILLSREIDELEAGEKDIQVVNHLKKDHSLLAFVENDGVRFVAPSGFQRYITAVGEPKLKLTSRLLMLRAPMGRAQREADSLRESLQG